MIDALQSLENARVGLKSSEADYLAEVDRAAISKRVFIPAGTGRERTYMEHRQHVSTSQCCFEVAASGCQDTDCISQ